MSIPTMSVTPAPAPLTTLDSCDRCGAPAQIRAVLPCGGELLFCGHHGCQHRVALTRHGAVFSPAH